MRSTATPGSCWDSTASKLITGIALLLAVAPPNGAADLRKKRAHQADWVSRVPVPAWAEPPIWGSGKEVCVCVGWKGETTWDLRWLHRGLVNLSWFRFKASSFSNDVVCQQISPPPHIFCLFPPASAWSYPDVILLTSLERRFPFLWNLLWKAGGSPFKIHGFK